MTSPLRRPRFERAKVAGIKLTPRDLLILRAVQRHRLLRSTHLIALGCEPADDPPALAAPFPPWLSRPASRAARLVRKGLRALGLCPREPRRRSSRRRRRARRCPAMGQEPQRLPPVPPPHPRRRRGHGGLRGRLPKAGGGRVHPARGGARRSATGDPAPAPTLPLAGRSPGGRHTPPPRSGAGSRLWAALCE